MGQSAVKVRDKPAVLVKGTPEDGQTVQLHGEEALRQVFNTSDEEQAQALLTHCLKVLKGDEASDKYPGNDERQFMVSIVQDLEPRDAVERMLAVQMAATHVAMVRSTRWLASADTIPQVQAHYTGYNKLARTYTAQAETLRKYRNGGKQTVTVHHVNVEDGGQAIVGNVQRGGRGNDKS